MTGCHPAPILEAAEHDLGTVAYSLQARPSARANLEICKPPGNPDKTFKLKKDLSFLMYLILFTRPQNNLKIEMECQISLTSDQRPYTAMNSCSRHVFAA